MNKLVARCARDWLTDVVNRYKFKGNSESRKQTKRRQLRKCTMTVSVLWQQESIQGIRVWRVCPMWFHKRPTVMSVVKDFVHRFEGKMIPLFSLSTQHKHWLWLTQLQCPSVELKGFKDSLFSSKLKVGGRTSKSEHLSVFRRNKGNHKMRTLKLKTQKQWLLSLFCSELKILFCFICSIIGHRTNGIEVIWLHWNEMS